LETNKALITHIKLNIGDIEEEELYLSAMIIGSDQTKLDKTIYENRVEFDHIDNYEREVIIKFIFEEERKRRKRRKGM
jgi:c-di-GMP-binding flagellar brake protein YcgR